jgi:hypothetical protein
MGGDKMNRKLYNILILVLILGVLILSTACWGSPSFTLIVENQSQFALTIYVNGHKMGDVNPGKQIEDPHFTIDTGKFKIEAKNIRAETIFSKTFTFDQMQRVDNKRIWKVVIPSQQN